MANITGSSSKNIYAPASSTYYYELITEFEETSTSTSNNTSTISCTATLKSHDIGFSGGGGTLEIKWRDNNETSEYVTVASKNVSSIAINKSTSISGTITVPHKSDGTLRGFARAVWTKTVTNAYAPNTDYVSTDGVNLTAIPRATSIRKFEILQRNETSFTANWETADTIDVIWFQYRKSGDSYSNWLYRNVADGTSGTFTISNGQVYPDINGNDVTINIEAGSKYWFKLRVRRKDSQVTTDIDNPVSQTTYDYPYITRIATSELTIGNSQTVYLYNPLSRNVTIYIDADNDVHKVINCGQTNQTSYTFTPNTSDLYASIRESVRGYCKYYGNYSSINDAIDGTYKIRGDEYPTFSNTDWSYESDYTSLTHNNQVVIKGKSDLTITINNDATSSYETSIDTYLYKCGSKTGSGFYGGTLIDADSNIIEVIAKDMRGLTTPTTKMLVSGTNYIPYSLPSIDYNNTYTKRANGIEAQTKLYVKGNLSVSKFGPNGENNTLNRADYRVYSYETNQYITGWIDIKSWFTLSGTTFSANDVEIHENGSSGGFTIGKNFGIVLRIEDAGGNLGYTTSNLIQVTDGKIAVDCFQDVQGNYHRGINGLGDSNYTQKINGSEYVTGLLQYGQSGRQDFGLAGFTYDQNGNMQHRRNNSGDNWQIKDYSGNLKLLFFPETGTLQIGNSTINSNGINKVAYDVLYNNTSGTNGSFNLSYGYYDWYDHIIIYFKNNDGYFNSIVVYSNYSDSGKPIVLHCNNNNDSYIWVKTKKYTLYSSGADSDTNGVEVSIGNGTVGSASGNNIYVTRVEGYK